MVAGHIAVVIPTRGHSGIWQLVADLLRHESFDALYVYDNGLSPTAAHALRKVLGKRGEVVKGHGLTIYQMWNAGWNRALADLPGPVNVAFLNDDISMEPETLLRLAVELRNDPSLWAICPDYEGGDALETRLDYVKGTYRHGGICGWCFMVKGELLGNPLELIDEQFEIWCGDDDLAFQIDAKGGKLGILRGLPVKHEGEATVSRFNLDEAKQRDLIRFAKKWNA